MFPSTGLYMMGTLVVKGLRLLITNFFKSVNCKNPGKASYSLSINEPILSIQPAIYCHFGTN